jgi:hypothetical protein
MGMIKLDEAIVEVCLATNRRNYAVFFFGQPDKAKAISIPHAVQK